MSTLRVGAASCQVPDALKRAAQRVMQTRAFGQLVQRMDDEARQVGEETSRVWPVRQRVGVGDVWTPTKNQHSSTMFGSKRSITTSQAAVSLVNGAPYAYFVRSRLVGMTLPEQRWNLAVAKEDYNRWRQEQRKAGLPVKGIGVGVRTFIQGPVKSGSGYIHALARKTTEKLAVDVVTLLARAAEEAIAGG